MTYDDQAFQELKDKSDYDLILIREREKNIMNSSLHRVAVGLLHDREVARQKKAQNLNEGGHDLLTYWRLADWGERFGMVSFLFGILVVGYLCASNQIISRIIALIRDVKP